MIVAYDGTGYSGFAKNNDVKTIEGELEVAVEKLTKMKAEIIGASRTDAGVHARCNVAVFDTESGIPPERFKEALNTVLPEDIRIMESYEVPVDFHPRHTKIRKIYEYRIYNDRIMPPTERLYSWHVYPILDVEAMIQGAEHLVGRHDFTSFCSENKNEVKDKVRTVLHVDVKKEWNYITVKVIGEGFLYHMVRIIVGTLVEVGLGKRNPDEIPEILEAKNRCKAGRTAPAHGLSLNRIEYL